MGIQAGTTENFRVVFRIEIATLLGSNGALDKSRMDRLVMICTNLLNSGVKVAVVSSGAIFLGASRLGLRELPGSQVSQQAAAAIGMAELITQYQQGFDAFNQVAAQVLLTKDVITNETMFQNARNTFDQLFEMNIVPVVNENDSVSTEDIELGDNYPLAYDVAMITAAHLIIIRKEQEGLYLLVCRSGEICEVDEDGLFTEVARLRNSMKMDGTVPQQFPLKIPAESM